MTRARDEHRFFVSLAFIALLLALGAAIATADEEANSSVLYPVSALEAAQAEPDSEIQGSLTDLQAAEELPHEDLGRAEAGDLLTSVFGGILEAPSSVYADLDVEAFRSDYAAVVHADDGSGPALLTSTLPLRAEDAKGQESVVDLGLVQSDGELQVVNPLVDVEIPAQLGEGIEIPEASVIVELAGAPTGRAPTALEDTSAFYPNVAPDSDLTVVPTPTGFETFTQLRSADAPLTQTFDLDLPSGAVLQGTEDGGAAVRREGETLMAVHPPTAIDAAGQVVAVDLAVSGHSLQLSVEPPEFAAYPILLDPIFESYMWIPNSTSAGINDWIKASSNPLFTGSWLSNWNQTLYIGLYMSTQPGAITPGAQVNWNYYVPRFFADMDDSEIKDRPTSYIAGATLSQVKYAIDEGAPYHVSPSFVSGIWSTSKGEWVWLSWRDGNSGPLTNPTTVPLLNPDARTDASNVGVALLTGEGQSYPRRAIVGQATVELGDKGDPVVEVLGSPGQWVNDQPASAFNYSVSDSGLGIYALELNQPKAQGGTTSITTSVGCVGTVSSPCPRYRKAATLALKYDPKIMPQGENNVKFAAIDPLGRRSDAVNINQGKVRVDHTKPTLALSGTATEQATLGTKLLSYNLKYNATDGDSANPEWLAPFGTSGAGKVESAMSTAVDSTGNVLVLDRARNKVLKYNKSGQYLSGFGTEGQGAGQFSGVAGIALSSSGTIWVAEDGYGVPRVQAFTPQGTFIRQITCSCFAAPYAVATGPGEALWVADPGKQKIFKFREDGTYLTAVSGAPNQLIEPTGVAVDSIGNLWVADGGLSKVLEFDSTGKFIFQFGSAGSGDGQLSGRASIDVAPSGNLMVAETGTNRLQEFKPDGSFLRKFATPGTGTGQLSDPADLAFASDGTVYVADQGNYRIARWAHADFNPQSGVASTEVKLDGQLVEPKHAPGCSPKDCSISKEWTLDVDKYPAGTHNLEVIATDGVGLATTKSISLESHGDLAAPTITAAGSMTEQATLGTNLSEYALFAIASDPGSAEERKSGVVSMNIKLDGQVVDSITKTCPAGGCSISRIWVLNANSVAPGQHTVLITATDAVGRVTTKTLSIETHGDLKDPTIALAGTSTEQATLGTTLPKYSLLVFASDPGSAEERKSGVASLATKVDGQLVDSATKSCPAGGCAIYREVSLKSDSYAPGQHTVLMTATDGVGHVTTKSTTFDIAKDTTAPALTATGALAEAPEGWVEQKTFNLQTSATDAKGYGLQSIKLKIDGQEVGSATGSSCEVGGCPLSKTFTVNAASYEGGAHPAEIIATDWAGNTAKKVWTINVSPDGVISAAEAESTLEAFDETTGLNVVGPSEEESIEGTAEDLTFTEEGPVLEAEGTIAPVALETQPDGALSVKVPEESAYLLPCSTEPEPEGPLSGEEEEELASSQGTCTTSLPSENPDGMDTVTIDADDVSSQATASVLIDAEAAAISANKAPNVDTIVRPLVDGAYSFTAIRDSAGPQQFSWEVQLEYDQELKQVDSKNVAIYWADGPLAFVISSLAAHDATGAVVETSLTVDSSKVITLHINHHENLGTGKPVTYPVVAGTGWEGGVQTYYMEISEDPDPQTFGTEELLALEGSFAGKLRTATFGPPLDVNASMDPILREENPKNIPFRKRTYLFNECIFTGPTAPELTDPPVLPPRYRAAASSECNGNQPDWTGGESEPVKVAWAVAIHGSFVYKWGHRVLIQKKPECDQWGPARPAKIACFAESWNSDVRINLLGRYRYPPGAYLGSTYGSGKPTCVEFNPVLPLKPRINPNGLFENGRFHWFREPVANDKPCPWGSITQVF